LSSGILANNSIQENILSSTELNSLAYFLDRVANFIHNFPWQEKFACVCHSDNWNFSAFFPTLWECKNFLWCLHRPMQQSTVFWVSEKPLVRLCVWVCVCEKELCLVKNAHRVQKWNSGLWVRLTSGKCLGVARHHHHFHHRPNHQLRHRVNKRAYSSYIRNAIPLYVNILHWNLCVRLCQTLGSWDQRCSQYLSLFLLFRTVRLAYSFHY